MEYTKFAFEKKNKLANVMTRIFKNKRLNDGEITTIKNAGIMT